MVFLDVDFDFMVILVYLVMVFIIKHIFVYYNGLTLFNIVQLLENN